jgi:hypothetical protein
MYVAVIITVDDEAGNNTEVFFGSTIDSINKQMLELYGGEDCWRIAETHVRLYEVKDEIAIECMKPSVGWAPQIRM